MNSTPGSTADTSDENGLDAALMATFDEILAIDELELTWLAATIALLQFCRTNQPSSEHWHDLLGGEPLTTVRESRTIMVAALKRADPPMPDQVPSRMSEFATLDALQELRRTAAAELINARPMWEAHNGSPEMLAVAIALAAARAIDAEYGATFVNVFRREPELQLEDGQPYPVTYRKPNMWLGNHAPNSNPAEAATRDMAWTPRLRIAGPRVTDFNFVLDFTLWDFAGPIGTERNLVLASGQPTLSLQEYDYENDGRIYYNRGPSDPSAQAKHVTDLLVAAGREGVHVMVLPEYSLNQAAVSELHARMESVDSAPRLMVAGFVEEQRGGSLVNRPWLCFHSGSERWPSHERLLPAKMTGAPVEGAAEGIKTGSEVRVFVTRQWTIAVLICRDAMDQAVVGQLGDLGVNMLLVPSMSPKSATMIDTLTDVRSRAQAFVVLANGPARWTFDPADPAPARGSEDAGEAESEIRVEAAFMGPYALPGSTVLAPSGQGAPPPLPGVPGSNSRGFWIFRSPTRQLTWHM